MSEWSVREEMVAGKAGSGVSVHSMPIQGVTGKSQPLLRSRGTIKPFAEGWEGAQSPPTSQEPHFTCDPAAEELQAEGDARVPGLWTDPDEACQQR